MVKKSYSTKKNMNKQKKYKRKNIYNKTKKGGLFGFSSSSKTEEKTECQKKLENKGYKENYGMSVSSAQGKEKRQRAIQQFYKDDKDGFDNCETELNLKSKYGNDAEYEEIKKESFEIQEPQKKTYKQGFSERLTDLSQSAKKTQKSISESSVGKAAYKGLVSGQTAAQLGYFFSGFPNNMEMNDGQTIKPFQNLKDNLRILSLIEPTQIMNTYNIKQEDFDKIKKMTYSATGEEIGKGISSGIKQTGEYIASQSRKIYEIASQEYCKTKLGFKPNEIKWLAVIGKAYGQNFNAEKLLGQICDTKIAEQIENPDKYLMVDDELNSYDKQELFTNYINYCFINKNNVLKYYKNSDNQNYGKEDDIKLQTNDIVVSTNEITPKIYLVINIDGEKIPIRFYSQDDKLHIEKYDSSNIYKKEYKEKFLNTSQYEDDSQYRNDFLLTRNDRFFNQPTDTFNRIREQLTTISI